MLKRLTLPLLCSSVLTIPILVVSCSTRTDKGPEPGSPEMPLRYVGPSLPEPDISHGGLRPVVGVQNYQVMRASRQHPHLQDDYGYTYNHQPMLAHWKGQFYLEYLSAPKDEVFNASAGSVATGDEKPCHTLLSVSSDGSSWSKPVVVFPAFELPDGAQTIAHQRMGFSVTPDGRLLVLAFYGTPSGPNDGKGVGRVVREIHEDGSFGPIYFIRYNRHAGWDESNTPYPFYREAEDEGFIAGCDALLADKLVTQQWWEEDRAKDGFFAISGAEDYSGKGWENKFSAKALSYWHRKDGQVVGIWKGALAALSTDEGQSWSRPVEAPNIAKSNAKHWGQRIDDGSYILAYCPQDGWGSRWPLALIQSDDGITFDGMLTVHGETPIRRYPGHNKDLGAQYVRGITEGNGDPPGDDLWLTYSVNKEDIWVSRVPVPVRESVAEPVDDSFDEMPVGRTVTGWNIYSPSWAPVSVAELEKNRVLKLEDRDPYDYARAVRVFPESQKVGLAFKVLPRQNDAGRLEIDVLDARGRRPVRVALTAEGSIAVDGEATKAAYEADSWLSMQVDVDASKQQYTLAVDGTELRKDAPFAETVDSVERVSFRTGEYRTVELDHVRKWDAGGVAPETDEPIDATIFLVDEVQTSTKTGTGP